MHANGLLAPRSILAHLCVAGGAVMIGVPYGRYHFGIWVTNYTSRG